jgi:hypothetical protein
MAAAVALTLAGACGGSSGGGPSGVDSAKQVSAVNEADKGSLCDWFVGMVGGYGAASTCDMAELMAPPDKATCTTEFPVCTVTVAQFEGCVQRMVSAQNTCTEAAITAAAASPECQAVGAAGCFN